LAGGSRVRGIGGILTIGLLLLGSGRASAGGNPDFDAVSWTAIGCDAADLTADASPGAVNFVGDASLPAAYYAYDASYLYFRYRMDRDPSGSGGFAQYSWTALMQVPSGNPFQYQYQVSLEGQTDAIQLWQNTSAQDIDFSPLFHDESEVLLFSQPYQQANGSTVNTSPLARRLPAGSSFDKDADYFVDFAIPVSVLVAQGAITGTADLAQLSFFPATSTNANNYNKGHLNCPFLPISNATIEKTVTPGLVPANTTTPVAYTIAVHDDGAVPTKGVVIEDIALPSYMSNVGVTVSSDDPTVTWEVVSANPLKVKVPTLPAAATVTVQLTADAAPTCADADFTNVATVSATNAPEKSDAAVLGLHRNDGFELCDGADNDCNGTADDTGDALCDDGMACNGTESCAGASGCQPGTALGCDDGNACTSDDCDDLAGCTHIAVADGNACDDGDACTQTDACQGGACTGANPVVCTPVDQCHDAGTCDPATGACSTPTAPDGTTCSDGNACTQTDACQGGVCTGANPVVCTPVDQCHDAGSCDPATGACSTPPAPDGTACSDGSACTQTDVCQGGACTGTSPVLCTALDQCHQAGSCDPATGVCSNPTVLDGAGCDDSNVCSSGDHCQAGTCTGATIPGCVACSTAADCGDGNSCTTDVCGASGVCDHVEKPGCIPCSTAQDCDDANACTADQCGTDGSCGLSALPGCVPCTTAADCDDANTCTSDTCSGGVCQHADDPSCTPQEICGNCLDDDGDGLVDAEDPDCCAGPVALDLRRLKLRPGLSKGRGNRLRMRARASRFAVATFDPMSQDTSVQLSDANGQIFCQTVAAPHWKHPRRRLYRFRDKPGAFAGGLKRGNFKMKRSGKVIFRTRGKTVSLRATDGQQVLVTLRVGNQCAQSRMSLRPKRNVLLFP
jgi:hypothetical protein